jgi:hypothetical protein
LNEEAGIGREQGETEKLAWPEQMKCFVSGEIQSYNLDLLGFGEVDL